MAPERFSKTKNRKNQGRYDNFSRKSAESFLQLIDSEKFSSYYSVPPEVPSSSVVYGDSVCLHASIFIAGTLIFSSLELSSRRFECIDK